MLLIISISYASCSVCNETCSPCGGGCTSTDMTAMYDSVTDFDATYGNFVWWNTSCITNMYQMFQGSDFNQVVLHWDTSQVTDMYAMFSGTPFSGDVSTWNTSNVIYMDEMFVSTPFDRDISGWDTSNVITMDSMFCCGNPFNQDISGWDTRQVTDMQSMFAYNPAFNQPIGSWDTSQVTDMSQMFRGSPFNQDISGWDTSQVIDMFSMFENTPFNQDISSWDVSSVENMEDMFLDATLSTTNYDALLNGWSGQSVQSGVIFNGGNSQYSSVGQVGRDILIDTYGWVITDGGLYTPPPTPSYVPYHSALDIPAIVIDFIVEYGLTMIEFVGIIVLIVLAVWVIKKVKQ